MPGNGGEMQGDVGHFNLIRPIIGHRDRRLDLDDTHLLYQQACTDLLVSTLLLCPSSCPSSWCGAPLRLFDS